MKDNTPKGILIFTRRNLRKVDFTFLHSSAIERLSKMDNYRPENLLGYKDQDAA